MLSADLRQIARQSGWVAPEDATGLETTGDVIVPCKEMLGIVLSHDCEFNEGKRSHFVMARVHRPGGKDVDIDELRAGNDIRSAADDGRAVAYDTFLLEPCPEVFDEPHIANFPTMMSLPMKVRDVVLGLKRAELGHETRVQLREKVALFFGRAADDVPDGDKSDAPA